MTFVKITAIIAIASATLALGACAHKNRQVQPAPATIGTSK